MNMKKNLATLLVPVVAAVTSLVAPLAAHADAAADLATVSAAGISSMGSISGIATGYAVPLFGLTVVGVGIAIAMKYIKKGKGAA
jgi:hypothetical protein